MPNIIVISSDTDDTFRWLSDGWYQIKQRGEPEAERLKALADDCIFAAENVPDAIKRLKAAGFSITRKI